MFDPQVRVLACDNCGAPLEGARDGAELTCAYCHATNRLDFVEELPPAPAITPEEQVRRLTAQRGRPRPPSPGVAEFLDGARLAPWREQEALAAWVQLRRELREAGGDAVAGRFFELTRLLVDAAHRADDATKERAFLETGYAVSRIPRQRTVLAAVLAQRAARGGDHDAARAWIERCDGNTDDLEAYSALTLARAMVRRDSPDEVLGLLGVPGKETLLTPSDGPLGAVLRAEALEQLGRVDDGAVALVRAAAARWPWSRAAVVLERDGLGGDVAPRAMALFAARRGHDHEARWRYDRVVGLIFGALWGGAGVTGVVLMLRSHWGFLVLALGGLGIGGGFVWMVMQERRQKGAWRTPVWSTVKKVTPPVGESLGTAELELDDAPGRTEQVNFKQGEHVEPGMRALVVRRFDPPPRWLT